MIQKIYKKIFISGVTFSVFRTLWVRIFILKDNKANLFIGKKTLFIRDKFSKVLINGSLHIDAKNNGQFWFYSSVRLLTGASLKINGTVNFFSGLQLKLFDTACLSIDDGTYFSGPVVIHSKENVTIGKNCSISWYCTIIDSNFHEIDSGTGIITKEVIIGDNVWIGNNVTILPGTIIEDDVIIGAQSLVKGHFLKGGIYAGNPAKLIRQRT